MTSRRLSFLSATARWPISFYDKAGGHVNDCYFAVPGVFNSKEYQQVANGREEVLNFIKHENLKKP